MATGGAAPRVGRQGEGPSGNGIFSRAGAGHPDAGHAEAAAEGRPLRQAHPSFFQDRFDQPRGAGAGARGRAGRRGGARGGTNRGARAAGTRMGFGTSGGDLRDPVAAAEAGAGASAAADDDGGTLRAYGDRGGDGPERGFEMAE